MRSADPGRVIAAARAWIGTPYHDQASLRGAGCDCLGLARGIWREIVGPEPFELPAYGRGWGETGDRGDGYPANRGALTDSWAQTSRMVSGATLYRYARAGRALVV